MAATIKVSSFGPAAAKIMVVGEAPGAEEVREGRPFIGKAGQLLRSVLSSSGINPEDVYYANLALERPPNNELRTFFDSSGVPNSQLVEGLTALRADIERINPNIIIPVGNYPLRFLTNRGQWKDGFTGITTYRGSILEGSAFCSGRKCLPTYHPAAALRDYSLKAIMRVDFGRAAREQHFSEIRRPLRCTVVEPLGAERALWAEWLVSPTSTPSPWFELGGVSTQVEADNFLTCDIEYIGSKLLCLGCTRNANVSVVFPTRSSSDIDFIRGILLSGTPLCFQNAMFDCSILEWFYGIDCLRFLKHDTMIAMHAAYTEFPKDLGFIASIFTEQPVWFEMPDLLHPGHWQLIDGKYWRGVAAAIGSPKLADYEKVYLPYNGIDVQVTHEAMVSMLSDELTDADVQQTYLHEMSLIQPLWSIGKRGVPINVEALNTLKSTLESEARTFCAGVASFNGGKEVNVKSPPQVAEFIYGVLGVPKTGPKTPTGRWKMDDDTLAALLLKASSERQRNGIKMIRAARERLDLISKFCEIELDDDGRMRCHYDPAKTVTGRLSSRKFYPTGRGTNLQNIPRDNRVRAVFVPDKGMCFAYADLKSAESLIVAHITGDPEMLRLHSAEYMTGLLDGHKYVASFLLEKPIDKLTKDERYLGKRVRHAGNYSIGWYRLMQLINGDAQETGVSVDAARAKQLIAKYRQLHPFLQTWWNDVQAQLWETRTIRTLHRRKRTFYGRPEEILPEAIAYNPQGTVGQTLNMGLLRLDPDYCSSVSRATNWQRDWDDLHMGEAARIEFETKSFAVNMLGFEMLLQVHDAIGFQFPESEGDRILPLVQDLMQIPVAINRRGVDPYTITIPVEIQVGYNWGEFDPKKPEVNPNGLKSWERPNAS